LDNTLIQIKAAARNGTTTLSDKHLRVEAEGNKFQELFQSSINQESPNESN
jgi:hypothetical protein